MAVRRPAWCRPAARGTARASAQDGERSSATSVCLIMALTGCCLLACTSVHLPECANEAGQRDGLEASDDGRHPARARLRSTGEHARLRLAGWCRHLNTVLWV